MKKIKIFLGAFVNYQAAQNINCRSLSKYLNKDKFEVSTILYPYPNTTDFVEEEVPQEEGIVIPPRPPRREHNPDGTLKTDGKTETEETRSQQ